MKTARKQIQLAIVNLLKTISKDNDFEVDLHGRVYDRQIFYDDVESFPTLCVIKGEEQRLYQPGQAWADLPLQIRIWTKGTKDFDAEEQLETIFGEIENLLHNNTRLSFGDNGEFSVDILINSISDDEGLLANEKRALGEMEITVRRHIDFV